MRIKKHQNLAIATFATFAAFSLFTAGKALADNTSGTAVDIGDVGEATHEGKVGGGGLGGFPPVATGDKVDYIKFTPLISGEATVVLEYNVGIGALSAEPTISVRNGSDAGVTTTVSNTSENSGLSLKKSVTHTWSATAGSSYYARVTASTGFLATEWSYKVTAKGATLPDNTIAGSVDLGALGSTTTTGKVGGFVPFGPGSDAVDYFKFRARHGGQMEVKLIYRTGALIKFSTPSATIRKSDDSVIEVAEKVTSVRDGILINSPNIVTRTLRWNGGAGNYHIRVASSTAIGSTSYSYTLEVKAPDARDDFEFNNSFAKAADLGALSGRNYLPYLTLEGSADNDFFKFRSLLPGPANVYVTSSRFFVPIGQDAKPAVTLKLLDKNQNVLASSPGQIVGGGGLGDFFIATISRDFEVAQDTDYYLQLVLDKVSVDVKSYAMTITVPELVFPELRVEKIGANGFVSFEDADEVFVLKQSMDLMNWTAVSATKLPAGRWSRTVGLPTTNYFRLEIKSGSSGGGVIVPRPDFGDIVVIPVPDFGPIIDPLKPILPPRFDLENPLLPFLP